MVDVIDSTSAPSKKVTQLPDAALPLTGAEYFPLVQGGGSVKATVSDIGPSINNSFIASPFVMASANPVTGNARILTAGAGITITDGGAGGNLTIAAPQVGTVTTVSVTTANGVSGSVANATTTPEISLTLGAITPTSVAASGTVTGSNLSGTNTGNVSVAGENYLSLVGQVLTANAVALGGTNVSGVLLGANGGTGVANTGRTLTLGGNLNTGGTFNTTGTFSSGGNFATTGTFNSGGAFSTASTFSTAGALTFAGAFSATLTFTAGTAVTFPTSGTLATLAGSEALTNKSYNGLTLTSTTGTFTLTNGKTLSVSNTLTFTGTDSTSFAFPSTSSTVVTTGNTASFTKGYSQADYDAGTKSSGTFTPDEANGNLQRCVNGGAFTLAPPTNNTTIMLQITNNGSAGTITTSGFTKVVGSSFTTTNAHVFQCFITKFNGLSTLNVIALQ